MLFVPCSHIGYFVFSGWLFSGVESHRLFAFQLRNSNSRHKGGYCQIDNQTDYIFCLYIAFLQSLRLYVKQLLVTYS